MIAINDLNVARDLDKAALEAVSGAGIHYSSSIIRQVGSTRYGRWSTVYSTLVSSNAWLHGVRHNKYWQRRYRTVSFTQRQSWYKYVG